MNLKSKMNTSVITSILVVLLISLNIQGAPLVGSYFPSEDYESFNFEFRPVQTQQFHPNSIGFKDGAEKITLDRSGFPEYSIEYNVNFPKISEDENWSKFSRFN